MTNLNQITSNETYKQVVADSIGGIMYNVTNYGKYDATKILALWDGMTDRERSAADGIVTGAINFLQGR